MKSNARILKFDVRELKTMAELRDAQLALLQDLNSGAVTDREWRPIQTEINALQRKWHKQLHAARTQAELKAIKPIFDH